MSRKIKQIDPFGGQPMPVETFTDRATDMVLTIRDGAPFLRTPNHDPNARVPEDFIVLMGIASSFTHPEFRRMMKAVVAQRHDQGELVDIIHTNGRDH